METVQIQLPQTLLQQIKREVTSVEAMDEVVAEAIEMWLEKKHQKKALKRESLQMLRQTGTVMNSERQRATAKAIIATLPDNSKTPSRSQVEASLAKVKVPLSEVIIAMRKER